MTESVSPLTDAALWLQSTLLGTVATAIAVIAIASVGFLMLSGRIGWHRGAWTVVGCFILFGAPAIASGIIAAARSGPADHRQLEPPAFIVRPAAPVPPAGQPQPVCWTCGTEQSQEPSHDPYAGASVR